MLESSKSSGLLSADTAVNNGKAQLCSVTLLTDGVNAATLVVYDNGSAASGTVLYKGSIAGASLSRTDIFLLPVRAQNGLYCDVTGTGANFIITYT